MSARLVIRAPGPQSALQDMGRAGGRRFGIPLGGAADTVAHRLALAVAGAAPDETSIEFRLMGPTVLAEGGPVRVVIGGPAPGRLTRASGEALTLEPWRSATLAPGDTLAVGMLAAGAVGYLACHPAPDIALVQGARGTMLRAGFGGRAVRCRRAMRCRWVRQCRRAASGR